MKVSVLISTYNGEEDIPRLLDSIGGCVLGNHSLEVILRDDHSGDRTADIVSQGYPWAQLIRGNRTVGFVKSNNIAVSQASGDVICCVNQDTILDSHFLVEGLNLLEARTDVVGVNSNMMMPWVLSLEDFIQLPRHRIPSYEYQLTPYGFAQYVAVAPIIRETNFLTGGGFFVRRSALKADEKLFDPMIHMYCEDTELSLRLRKRGGRLAYCPGALLYHHQVPKKVGSFSALKKLLKITWNRFYVLSKHATPMEFLRCFPLYLFGLVAKMGHLGVPSSRKPFLFVAGACLALPFSSLLPYWLWQASRSR